MVLQWWGPEQVHSEQDRHALGKAAAPRAGAPPTGRDGGRPGGPRRGWSQRKPVRGHRGSCSKWATAPQGGSGDPGRDARTRPGGGLGGVGALRPRVLEAARPAALAVAVVAAVLQQLQGPGRVEVGLDHHLRRGGRTVSLFLP